MIPQRESAVSSLSIIDFERMSDNGLITGESLWHCSILHRSRPRWVALGKGGDLPNGGKLFVIQQTWNNQEAVALPRCELLLSPQRRALARHSLSAVQGSVCWVVPPRARGDSLFCNKEIEGKKKGKIRANGKVVGLICCSICIER